MLTQDDITAAKFWLDHNEHWYTGGSVIVKQLEANDIDIVAPDYAVDHATLTAQGWEQNLHEGDGFYEDPTIESTWRKDNLNLIVCTADYNVANKASVAEMKRNPDLYQTREQRVELHKGNRAKITAMLKGKGMPNVQGL